MRTLKRKISLRALPASAEIQLRRRQATAKERARNPNRSTVTEKIASWKTRGGKKQQGVVVELSDGTTKVRVKSPIWTAKFRTAAGDIREVSTGCRDKDAARGVLDQLARREEDIASGRLSPEDAELTKHQNTSLTTHITDYIAYLKELGRNGERIKTSETYLTEDSIGSNFRFLRDLNADKLRKWLNSREGMSAATYNWHSSLWTAFGWWLCGKRLEGKRPIMNGEKRLGFNPFDGLGKKDVDADRKRKARALTSDELERLIEAGRTRPLEEALTVRRGPNKGMLVADVSDASRQRLERLGNERALIYKTLVLTGLRANELRTLTVRDLSFGDVPFLKLMKGNEKSRKGSTLPLRDDLAAELRQWVDGMDRGDKVFDVPEGILRIMNRDLKRANIPKVDEDGCVVHVHALRHSFGTHLSKSGVAPRVAQAAMRHSDIALTMNTYTDARLLDTAGAVNSLDLLRPKRKLATDSAAPPAAPNAGDSKQFESLSDDSDQGECSDGPSNNPGISQAFPSSDEMELMRFELTTSALRRNEASIEKQRENRGEMELIAPDCPTSRPNQSETTQEIDCFGADETELLKSFVAMDDAQRQTLISLARMLSKRQDEPRSSQSL